MIFAVIGAAWFVLVQVALRVRRCWLVVLNLSVTKPVGRDLTRLNAPQNSILFVRMQRIAQTQML